MRFVIFVIDDGLTPAGPGEMDAIGAFNDKLKADGHFITAEGIESGSNATVIDNRAGAGIVTAGSLYSEPERYTGFWLIEAVDQAQAHSLAHEASLACNRKVEVRAYLVP
jgi:hypothetical protein